MNIAVAIDPQTTNDMPEDLTKAATRVATEVASHLSDAERDYLVARVAKALLDEREGAAEMVEASAAELGHPALGRALADDVRGSLAGCARAAAYSMKKLDRPVLVAAE